MPCCINDKSKRNTGNEPSPTGIGYSSTPFRIGTKKKGRDGKFWLVKKYNDQKRWVKVAKMTGSATTSLVTTVKISPKKGKQVVRTAPGDFVMKKKKDLGEFEPYTIDIFIGGKYSYFSAHASNTTAVAVFFSLLLKSKSRYLVIFLLIWAILVAYSRIYIGVHFPLDVVSGCAIGLFFGWLFAKLYIFVLHRRTV